MAWGTLPGLAAVLLPGVAAAGSFTLADTVNVAGTFFVIPAFFLSSGQPPLLGTQQTLSAPNLGQNVVVPGPIADQPGVNGQVGVSVNGPGKVILTGVNTYTGTTQVNSGTLALGAGGSIIDSNYLVLTGGNLDISAGGNQSIGGLFGNAGTQVVLGNNTLTTGQNITGYYGGVISGSGGLVVAGRLALTGANLYTGGTTILVGGTLQLGDDFINTGSVRGNISNYGQLFLAPAAATLALNGVISGSGLLVQQGPGTTILTAVNNFTGSTIVTGGTLAIGAGGSIASSSSVTLNGGSFDISAAGNQTISNLSGSYGNAVIALGANTLTAQQGLINGVYVGNGPYAGVIIGSGGLVVAGSGVLTLTGPNIYTGGTTINPGAMLQLGAGGFGGSIMGNVADAGTLVFNRSDNVSFGGTVFGSGGLTQNGGGALTLTAANSYTGATTINAGTLSIGAGGSIANSSGVAINGGSFDISSGGNQTIGALSGVAGTSVTLGANTLTTGNGTSSTYAGVISGTGGLVVTGAGTQLTLNGANTFTGGTTITNASLSVGDAADPSASLASNVTVNTGGLLRGHGTIIGDVANTAGTVFPGGTIGTLSVNGNYTQGPAGTLSIETGLAADQLVVSGHATLGGTLAVLVDGGTYVAGSKYTIIQTGTGISGSFARVAYNPAFASYLVPTLSVQGNNEVLQLAPTTSTAGNTGVSLAGLLFLPQFPASLFATQTLPSSYIGDPQARAFVTGRAYASNAFITDETLFNALGVVMNGGNTLVGPGVPDADRGFWMGGTGTFGTANGASVNGGGAVVGKGGAITPHLVAGVAVAGMFTDTGLGQGNDLGQSVGVFGYGTYTAGRLRVSATAGGGALSNNFSRNLYRVQLDGRANNSGGFAAGAARAQYQLGTDQRFLIPYADAMLLHTGVSGATETGAGSLDLHYAGVQTDLMRVSGGVQAGVAVPSSIGTLLPWARLGVAGIIGNTHVGNTETLGLYSANETAIAAPPGAVITGAGVNLATRGPWQVMAEWDGQYGSGTIDNTFTLQAKVAW